MCAGSSCAGAGGVYTDSPCLQTVAVSLSIKALLKKNNNMCAVTDKVWAIKGVGSFWGGGGTPFTSLAPLQFSNKTSFTGVRCNFHTIKLLSASQEVGVCGTLFETDGFDRFSSSPGCRGNHRLPTSVPVGVGLREGDCAAAQLWKQDQYFNGHIFQVTPALSKKNTSNFSVWFERKWPHKTVFSSRICVLDNIIETFRKK